MAESARIDHNFSHQTTESQREIWAACQFGVDASLAYNESVTLTIDGRIDGLVLSKSIVQLITRHESLRIVFSQNGMSFRVLETPITDIAVSDDSRDTSYLAETKRVAVSTPFDLEHGPLFRAVVIPGQSQSHVVLTAHHIICDGWSIAILIRDLAKIYSRLMAGAADPMEILHRFTDFAKVSADYQRSEQADTDLRFWSDRLTKLPPSVDLPCDKPRPKNRTVDSGRLDLELPAHITQSFKKLAAGSRASFFMALVGSYHVLLWKICGDLPIAVFIPAAAQAGDGLFELVGHCVNTLPINCLPVADESFITYLARVKTSMLDAYDHQKSTIGAILQHIHVKRDSGRVPITPVLFNFDKKFDSSELCFGKAPSSYQSNPRLFEAFELFINITETDKTCVIECQYNSNLFSNDWVDSHLNSFATLLEAILLRSGAPISELSWAPVSQLEEQYFEWNSRKIVSDEKNFLELFERVSHGNPDNMAVICGEKSRTYRDVSLASNRWADYLTREGVRPGDFIGIATERGVGLPEILLGILKCGACYVPIDPAFPPERIKYMMEHSATPLILKSEVSGAQFPELSGCRHITVESVDLAQYSDKLPTAYGSITGSNLAYVIFTSGSTGNPKGVMVPHKGVLNFLLSMAEETGISPEDRLLAVTTLSFDISVLELFLPLVIGSAVVLATKDQIMDGNVLGALLEKEKISFLQATPALWRLLFDSGWSGNLRKGLVGGEALSRDLADLILDRVDSLWNVYGPTETTVWSAISKVDRGETIRIGRPIAGTDLFVVDRFLQAVPRYVPGELIIGGVGVTRGYLGRDDLTRERFIKLNGVPYLGNCYRTGDLVRFHNTGDLEYIGRNDNQVKVRGFRIELGEIEARISGHPGVNSVVVVVREDRVRDQRLVAYFEVNESGPAETELRTWCVAYLPAYMVPHHFVEMAAIPRLPNGKTNRNALPAPNFVSSGADSEDLPVNELEIAVAVTFAKFLGIESVPVTRNFFNLGGHSLLAIRMLAELQEVFKVSIPLRSFMADSTVRGCARAIGGSEAVKLSPIPEMTDGVLGRLSIIQERVYYIDTAQPEDVANLLPDGRIIEGPLDVGAFQSTLRQIMTRHPLMRGIVESGQNGPILRIRENIDIDLDPEDLTALSEDERNARVAKITADLTSQHLDVHSENLIRIRILKLGDNKYYFASVFHHLIWDGWCFDIFWSEIYALYFAKSRGTLLKIKEPASRYLDFALWHREKSKSEEYLSQLTFWKEYLQDMECLELPTDHPRPRKRGTAGRRQSFSIDAVKSSRIAEISKNEGTTSFVVMLAMFKYMLSLYSGQSDIIVATPVQGRGHPDLSNVIGYFVNTLVLRTDLTSCRDFLSIIRAVKRSTTEAMQHEDVAFEDIVSSLELKPDSSRTMLYSVMFAYQDTSNRDTDWHELTLKQVSLPQVAVGTDLTFWVRKHAGGTDAGFDYRTDIFSDERMAAMIDHYGYILSQLLEEPRLELTGTPVVSRLAQVGVTRADGDRKALVADILANAGARDKLTFLRCADREISGRDFRETVLARINSLRGQYGPRANVTLQIGTYSSAVMTLVACIANGYHVDIKVDSKGGESAVVGSDPSGARSRVFPETSYYYAETAQVSLDGFQLSIDCDREASQFFALSRQLGSHRMSECLLFNQGRDSIRWLLFSLMSFEVTRVHSAHVMSATRMARLLPDSGETCYFFTVEQLANLMAVGWRPAVGCELVVAGAAATNYLISKIMPSISCLFVVSNDEVGSWFASAQSENSIDGLRWSGLGCSLSVARQSGESGDSGSILGPFMSGNILAERNGRSKWIGSFDGRGFRVEAEVSQTTRRNFQFLLRPGAEAAQLRCLSNVLYALQIDFDQETGLILLPDNIMDETERDMIIQDFRAKIPGYLAPDFVKFIDQIPVSIEGVASRDHPLFEANLDYAEQDNSPKTFAERELAAIWEKVLRINKVERHDNFFDLGGYSLLPLIIINEIEERTGLRLVLSMFLTQNLSGIAAQCGFKDPGMEGTS